MFGRVGATLAILAVSATGAFALTVTNPGFETISGVAPGNTYNEFTFGAFDGWSVYDPTGTAGSANISGPFFVGTLTPFVPDPIGAPGVYAFFPAGAPEGNRVAIAFNYANTLANREYGLSQTLTDTLQPNTKYTLQVEIGNIGSGVAFDNSAFNLAGFPGYRVDLLAGGVVLASDANTLAGAIAEGTFQTSTVEFTTGTAHAQLNQPLSIRLVNLNVIDATNGTTSAADREVDFDNVRLDASPVPEPASLAILATGCAMLLRRR